MRRLIPVLLIAFTLVTASLVKAEPPDDLVFFSQVTSGRKTIYSCRYDGTDLRSIVSGKSIRPFLVGKHFLFFSDHQLFEYNVLSRQTKLLTRFSENEIAIQQLAGGSGGPDQALVLALGDYGRNYYILEFSDGSIRPAQNNYFTGTGSTALKGYSPDEKSLTIVRQASVNFRFELILQEKMKEKFKTTWTLPNHMTVIPEGPVWSPNSRMIAFYAKEFNSPEGFYSLYIFNLDTRELRLIQEQVFSKFAFGNFRVGPFIPNWSKDSRNIVFQYQPYGIPTESSIIKYEIEAEKKVVLYNSHGHMLYPSWSPSGRNILFLANQETNKDQLYVISGNGEKVWRLSPSDGYSEWAVWYNPE